MTIALTNRPFINLDKDNNILNAIGEVAAVAHQYDRFKDINKILKNKYYNLEFKQLKEEREKMKKKKGKKKKKERKMMKKKGKEKKKEGKKKRKKN